MSKTFLVAKREFVENLRTKTFWIGILVAPILIILFYGVMFLLADKTDRRTYAVLDRSEGQWLSKEVEATIKQGNIEKLSQAVANQDEKTLKAEGSRLLSKIEMLPDSNLIKQRYQQRLKAVIAQRTDATGPPTEKERATAIVSVVEKAMEDTSLWGPLKELADEYLGDAEFVRKHTPDLGSDPEKALSDMLQKEEIFAYLVIGEKPLDGGVGSTYVSNNITDFKLRNWYSRKATRIIQDRNILLLKQNKMLSQDEVNSIKREFKFTDKQISETGEITDVKRSDRSLKWAPILFVYILWMGVFIAAQMLLTNTVEEKSNRIIEVLLSSVSATQLMHGKIYGIALTGMTVLGSWALFLVLGIKLAPHLIEGSGGQIAELGLDQIVGNPVYAASFLGYFLTGYLMYASLLVAIGSVCNSLKEAQNLMQPLIFVLIVPLATMFPIAMDPNGTVARIMTYIPLYTPFTMMNRAGGPPAAWEYVASSAVILVTLWLFFRGAAKVFRIGVLMTGKPPRIGEILRWMRAPVK